MNRARQAVQAQTATAEQPARPMDGANRPREIVSPYLTSHEAVAYLRLPSLSSLYSHIRENRLPVLRAGGELRFDTRELDAWLRGTTAIELVRSRKRVG